MEPENKGAIEIYLEQADQNLNCTSLEVQLFEQATRARGCLEDIYDFLDDFTQPNSSLNVGDIYTMLGDIEDVLHNRPVKYD